MNRWKLLYGYHRTMTLKLKNFEPSCYKLKWFLFSLVICPFVRVNLNTNWKTRWSDFIECKEKSSQWYKKCPKWSESFLTRIKTKPNLRYTHFFFDIFFLTFLKCFKSQQFPIVTRPRPLCQVNPKPVGLIIKLFLLPFSSSLVELIAMSALMLWWVGQLDFSLV